jgi:ParB family chromosome partitioning protein
MSAKDVAPRLGRGLAALIGEMPSASMSDTPSNVAIDRLRPGPFQPRHAVDAASLAELVESIRRQGVLQPILVRPDPADPGRYQIIAGERRWRAAQSAGLHEIPAVVRELPDAEAMAAALVENLQREDLNAIEEAEGYRRLIDEFGLTQEQLGDAVGKSRSHIANALRLLGLPANVRAHVQSGALTAGHARALLAHPDPEGAARAVIARNLNVRQTEALVRQMSAPRRAPPAAPRAAAEPETAALERDLSERLGLRVQIAFDGAGGSIRIHYHGLDQLDGLVALLMRE